MVPMPLTPARARRSRTCADVIQPCSLAPLPLNVGGEVRKNLNAILIYYESDNSSDREINSPLVSR